MKVDLTDHILECLVEEIALELGQMGKVEEVEE